MVHCSQIAVYPVAGRARYARDISGKNKGEKKMSNSKGFKGIFGGTLDLVRAQVPGGDLQDARDALDRTVARAVVVLEKASDPTGLGMAQMQVVKVAGHVNKRVSAEAATHAQALIEAAEERIKLLREEAEAAQIAQLADSASDYVS
jgi:hypothetical protein